MRYICRLPRISYNNRNTAQSGCFSSRKLCKEFGPYIGFVMALKEIIASPRWIKAWVERLFAGVEIWFYVTNVWWKGRGSNYSTLTCTYLLTDKVKTVQLMLYYWLRLEIMVALQAAILTFLAFAYETDFFSSIQWMKLQFLEKICYNKRGSFVLLHKF